MAEAADSPLSSAAPSPLEASREYIDLAALEDPRSYRPSLLIDSQVHVFRGDDMPDLTEGGAELLGNIAGGYSAFRARSQKLPDADLGRAMMLQDVFLSSETQIAALNAFGMSGTNVDGVDLFSPREAAFIRSMMPNRLLVLGTVDPPDGSSAIESLDYQCSDLRIDGLKLYPTGRFTPKVWRLDDPEVTYPLYDVMRRHGVKNVFCHKGLPGPFIADACRGFDLVQAATENPDLNFVAYHAAFPFDEEMAQLLAESKLRNVYIELGAIAPLMIHPKGRERFAMMLGRYLNVVGPDRILWGTDYPQCGLSQYQIDALTTFQIPERLVSKFGFPKLTADTKRKILGENAAELFGIDVASRVQEISSDNVAKSQELNGNKEWDPERILSVWPFEYV
jgi:hypothetical protein